MTNLRDPYIVQHDGTVDGHGVQRNFEDLARRLIDTGGRTVALRFGTATITYTASATSATTTVTHGLGKTPVAIAAIATHGTAFNVLAVESVGTTTFGVIGRDSDATVRTGSDTFYWIAIA